MHDKRFVHVGKKVWGMMPSGEIKEFETEYGYHIAYDGELEEFNNEMDRLAEANAQMFPEVPEDFYPGYGIYA